ncbi:MAG: SdpI family protein [Chloroflexota bacterium]|nr:SdpI family protein [Chloroflexota bacterium]
MTFPSRTTSLAATTTAAAASALAYPFLPNRIATHFDDDGRPDRYSSRASAAVLFPAMMLGMQVLNDRLGAWPGGRDRPDRESGVRARDGAVAMVELALLPAHVAILAKAAGLPIDMRAVNRGVFVVLMVALGNVLPKLPRNGLIGIRTPWTLADPIVWERTHRVGGYLVTAAGLVSLASLSGSGKAAARVPTIASFSAVGLSVAYSLVAYRRRSRLGH